MDLQWLQSDEAQKISDDAKAKAWNDFKRKYPFADLSKHILMKNTRPLKYI